MNTVRVHFTGMKNSTNSKQKEGKIKICTCSGRAGMCDRQDRDQGKVGMERGSG